jgi:hypothetical protein
MNKILKILIEDKWNRILAVIFLLAISFQVLDTAANTNRIRRLEKAAKMIPTQSNYDRARNIARICMSIEDLRNKHEKLKLEFKLAQKPISVPGVLNPDWHYLVVYKNGIVYADNGQYMDLTLRPIEKGKKK